MTFTIRVRLADRPGTLARIATALGAVGANIVELDVLERSVETAVDNLLVEAPGLSAEAVRSTLDELDGVVVELLRPSHHSAGLPPLGLAVRLGRAHRDAVLQELVDGVVLTFGAAWAAVVAGGPTPAAQQRSAAAPATTLLRTPWLPLRDVRRLSTGPWTPPGWHRAGGDLQLAAAPLGSAERVVLVCRPDGPRFAQRELADLALLADLAVSLGDDRSTGAVTTAGSRAL